MEDKTQRKDAADEAPRPTPREGDKPGSTRQKQVGTDDAECTNDARAISPENLNSANDE